LSFQAHLIDQQTGIKQTKENLLKLKAEVENIEKTSGILPESEKELVKLRGAPMPLTAWKIRSVIKTKPS